MLQRKLDFEIYADYNQFYLECESSPHKSDEVWDSENVAFNRMLGVGEKLIAVGTARYRTVPVSIEFYDTEPRLEFENYSRINECSLEVSSNKLILSGCTEYLPDAARIEVEPGTYRVRILYGNAETITDEDNGDDFYILQLWKDAEFRGVETLKP
jgi:hypothetical protein